MISHSKKDQFIMLGTQKIQQPSLMMSSEEPSRQQSRESSVGGRSSNRDFLNLPHLGTQT